jgi:hypothetical protein
VERYVIILLVLQQIGWPEARFQIFGSAAGTAVGIYTSDVDMAVNLHITPAGGNRRAVAK